jgi:hypothetical protein
MQKAAEPDEDITSIPIVLTGTMHQTERLRLRDYAQFRDPTTGEWRSTGSGSALGGKPFAEGRSHCDGVS